MAEKIRIPRESALPTAKKLVKTLEQYCDRIEIAGSLRRRRPWVHDIDIVLIPTGDKYWELLNLLMKLGGGAMGASGNKILRFLYGRFPVDIYIATEETWFTLLLIRTGSAEHNRMMCSRAKDYGWTLRADGSGLVDGAGELIAGESEESIFKALRLKYKQPWERG
jgi:DNA polymerase/3'-5' exonuclease PolX